MKTIKINLLLIFLLPLTAFSQTNSYIDLVGGIEYSNKTKAKSTVISTIGEGETGKVNFRIGMNYNKRFGENIWLKTGLRVSSVGYNGEKQTGIRWASEHDGNGGYQFDPSLPHELQFKYDYWYLEVPLIARIELKKEGYLIPFVEFGISPHFFLTRRTKQIDEFETKIQFSNNSISGDTGINLVSVISFGLNYSKSEKYQIFAQPVFRYHHTKINENEGAPNFYNFGIELGLRRKLN